MQKATENCECTSSKKITDEESEDIARTCSRDSDNITSTASEEIGISADLADEGPEVLSGIRVRTVK
jgi:hypothetical protein